VQADISKRFGQKIRALRNQRGWTQEKAAEMCGLGQKLFQLYESGIKDNPGLKTLEKIARGFGMEVHELLAPPPAKSTSSRRSKKLE
jgi:transcriptional regulator with XRE-family HTH domain